MAGPLNGALTAAQVVQDAPVIPVIVVSSVAQAVPLARALVAGGLRMLEVTLRTPGALACVQAIAGEVPDAIVGAGTVRSAADAQAARAAGARFIVSPGYTGEIGRACRDLGVPLLPGVATASEILAAHADGFDVQKFFPAVAAGGIALLQAWHGPFPDIRFCPTGGITAESAPQFLALPNVACVGGSWMLPRDAVQREDWQAIEQAAHRASQLRPPA